MLRSPWLGLLAIAVAGITGYALSDASRVERVLEDVTVTIRPTRDTGGAWDFGGGLPDPQIRVEHDGNVLATCEAKDVLRVTCPVRARIDKPVRVSVIDVDNTDHDLIGEQALDAPSTGALVVAHRLSGGGNAWERFRALWIALAIGLAIAGALAMYRRRHP